MKPMTLEDMGLVRQECANLVANVCIGMTTHNALWREVGKCLIAEGDTCSYYSKCLTPLIEKQRPQKVRRRR